ncbi:MAG TPA: hypothetical protein VLT36_16915 [Candidatus Dormibacteraeota bacterium]|nr:hypothetical protein [Candidatus Dormibacteraeota bacterium]
MLDTKLDGVPPASRILFQENFAKRTKPSPTRAKTIEIRRPVLAFGVHCRFAERKSLKAATPKTSARKRKNKPTATEMFIPFKAI